MRATQNYQSASARPYSTPPILLNTKQEVLKIIFIYLFENKNNKFTLENSVKIGAKLNTEIIENY